MFARVPLWLLRQGCGPCASAGVSPDRACAPLRHARLWFVGQDSASIAVIVKPRISGTFRAAGSVRTSQIARKILDQVEMVPTLRETMTSSLCQLRAR